MIEVNAMNLYKKEQNSKTCLKKMILVVKLTIGRKLGTRTLNNNIK